MIVRPIRIDKPDLPHKKQLGLLISMKLSIYRDKQSRGIRAPHPKNGLMTNFIRITSNKIGLILLSQTKNIKFKSNHKERF